MLLDRLRVVGPRLLLLPWAFAVYRLSLVPWPCRGLLHPDLFPPDLEFPGRAYALLCVGSRTAALFLAWGVLAALAAQRPLTAWVPSLLLAAGIGGLGAWLGYRTMYDGYVSAFDALVMGSAVALVGGLSAAVGALLGLGWVASWQTEPPPPTAAPTTASAPA